MVVVQDEDGRPNPQQVGQTKISAPSFKRPPPLSSPSLVRPAASMAKPTAASKKRKQQASKSNAAPANKKANTAQPLATTDLETVPLEHDTSDLIGGMLLPEEVESTIDVLQMVSKNPEVLKLKELKGLKGACFEAMRMIKEVSGEGPPQILLGAF
jgi:hypothetical protein